MIVEIKVRELRAKLLLAAHLAQHGYRVYVGTRGAITKAITGRATRAGVYFFKGGERAEVLRRFSNHCEFIVGQDEELGPALTADEVIRNFAVRFPDEFAQLVDELYLYSPAHLEILRETRPSLAQRAVVTGWPRADLWSPVYRGTDEELAADIRRQRGRFVLFVSNFKVTSPRQRDRVVDAARRRLTEARDSSPDLTDRSALARSHGGDPEYGTLASDRLAAFRRTIDLIREAAASSSLPIIVRPHPAEDPATWNDALAGIAGVEVAHEGEVGPWLLAAAGVMHTGCTTAVQAAHYGAACGMLMPGRFVEASDEAAPAAVSVKLEGLEDFRQFIHRIDEGHDLVVSDVDGGGPAHRWMGPTDGLATNRIVDAVKQHDVTPERPVPRSHLVGSTRMLARLVATGRNLVDSRIGRNTRFVGTNAQPKVPGGIHRAEVRSVLESLAWPHIHVEEPQFDLVVLSSDTIHGGALVRRRDGVDC